MSRSSSEAGGAAGSAAATARAGGTAERGETALGFLQEGRERIDEEKGLLGLGFRLRKEE